jgi:hypothetical protein
MYLLISKNFVSLGFADTIQGLQLLGLMDPNPHPALHPKGPDITWVSMKMLQYSVCLCRKSSIIVGDDV